MQGDGYGRGEGFAVAMLYPIEDTAQVTKMSLALVCGSAINQVRSSPMYIKLVWIGTTSLALNCAYRMDVLAA